MTKKFFALVLRETSDPMAVTEDVSRCQDRIKTDSEPFNYNRGFFTCEVQRCFGYPPISVPRFLSLDFCYWISVTGFSPIVNGERKLEDCEESELNNSTCFVYEAYEEDLDKTITKFDFKPWLQFGYDSLIKYKETKVYVDFKWNVGGIKIYLHLKWNVGIPREQGSILIEQFICSTRKILMKMFLLRKQSTF